MKNALVNKKSLAQIPYRTQNPTEQCTKIDFSQNFQIAISQVWYMQSWIGLHIRLQGNILVLDKLFIRWVKSMARWWKLEFWHNERAQTRVALNADIMVFVSSVGFQVFLFSVFPGTFGGCEGISELKMRRWCRKHGDIGGPPWFSWWKLTWQFFRKQQFPDGGALPLLWESRVL